MAYEKAGLCLSHIVFSYELALALPHPFSILDSSLRNSPLYGMFRLMEEGKRNDRTT